MKRIICFVCFLGMLFFGCQSDDENNGPETIITSFSGTVQYENGEPVSNAELIIGSRVNRSFGTVAGDAAFLQINDGTFEVTFETEEEVVRYNILIDLYGNVFTFGEELQCIPGDCGDFSPGESYELTIILPCTLDECANPDL
ncbi:MAG: hypothetical protein AAGC45_10520 [Bacteroidota bacterium]